MLYLMSLCDVYFLLLIICIYSSFLFCRAIMLYFVFFFFSSRRRHTRFDCDWSSDVCSSDLTCSHCCRRPKCLTRLETPGLSLLPLLCHHCRRFMGRRL